MKAKFTVIYFLAILCSSLTIFGQTPDIQIDPAVKKLGENFKSLAADVNGTRIHYVRGGNGPAIILIHGFPQDWSEFRKIMPNLATKFTIIAIDMRGIGGSKATAQGYDAANLAKDVEQLAEQLKLKKILCRRT